MNLKEMEAEITRLQAQEKASVEKLTARDSEIAALKAEVETLKKANADSDAGKTAANESAQKLEVENKDLKGKVEKLTAELSTEKESASRKALEIVAKSGHPAPIEGNSPKDDGEPSKLKGVARATAAFSKKFPQFA